MPRRETVPQAQANQAQVRDVVATVTGGVPDLSFDEAETLTHNKGPLVARVKATIRDYLAELQAQKQQLIVKAVSPQPLLHRLFEDEVIVVGATDGMETLAEARNVFGHLDPDFQRWGTNKSCQATAPTRAAVYELRRDATFRHMFGSLGELNTLVWEQSQIVEFCRKHRGKLQQGGYGSLFLFKVDDTLYIVFVSVSAGGLTTRASRSGFGHLCHADYRPRVIVPLRLRPLIRV